MSTKLLIELKLLTGKIAKTELGKILGRVVSYTISSDYDGPTIRNKIRHVIILNSEGIIDEYCYGNNYKLTDDFPIIFEDVVSSKTGLS